MGCLRVQVLQHVPFEGLGAIEAWLQQRDARVDICRLFASEPLPALSDGDLLIVLGGPMSVHDLEAHPWLTDEMTLLAADIRAGHPLLGICLGAQLMAKALGAAVRPGVFREIGWFPVEGIPSRADGLTFPASFEAFHWHGDRVDLPPGAELLAQSPACPVQAFQIGTRAIGLQFHLETTPTSVRHLLQHCQADLIPGPYVQSPSDLLAAEPTRYSRLHLLLDQVMASLLRPPS